VSGASFRDLFAWEWRRAARQPLLWLALATIAASFVWGAVSTAGLHRTQGAAITRALAADAAWTRSIHERAATYRSQVTPQAGQVAYWQDPTNVAGYSEYFVRAVATKPHLLVSPLAAGVSDVAPSRLDIRLNTPFAFGDTYDFENPRGLALGRFDLAFAIVFLLPLNLLVTLTLSVSFERDRGMLRLVAAQTTSPRRWIGARVAALMAWLIPGTLLALVASLAIAGTPVAAQLATVLTAALLVAAYMLFWCGLALIVLATLPGAGAALGTLGAIWALLVLGLPLAASGVTRWVDPAPSPLAYVDAQRRTADAIGADQPALLRQALLNRADLRAHADRIATLDHATKLSFLVPETERRLAPLRAEMMEHRTRQERIARLLGFLIPSTGLELALANLAGTDPARQRAFEAQARAHQLRLRALVHPLVQAQITSQPPPATRATRGIFTLPAPLDLPPFRLIDRPTAARIAGTYPFLLWLAALGALATGIGLSRARRWTVI
jgi:ABC-2 type transport system permease protein